METYGKKIKINKIIKGDDMKWYNNLFNFLVKLYTGSCIIIVISILSLR